ncbi:MAG: HipA protein [Faecalibacterium sp.]
MDYLLMNKDTVWLEFSCERDEYDEVIAEEHAWHTKLRPFGYYNLTDFLERRKAPKHRAHIAALLKEYGCEQLDGYLDVTHALSLNDTFWVKPVGSSLLWDDVSLYRNPFNEVISEAAFDGMLSSSAFSSTSPEFSTDGQYAKCWVRQDGVIWLYKTGGLFGLEPLSEYLAGQLAVRLCPDSARYDMDFYRGQLISKCQLFTDETHGLAKAAALVLRERTISNLLRYFESIGSGDSFRRMCILDALILNIDRHIGNFGVLYDNDTMQVQRMAPVFDNNRSLLFDLDNDHLKNIEACVRHCTPRLGSDFIATARGLLTEEIRHDLLDLRDFAFAQHPHISAEQERLDSLSRIVQYQLKQILQ